MTIGHFTTVILNRHTSTYVYDTCYEVSAIKRIRMHLNLLAALSKSGITPSATGSYTR